MAKSKKKKKDEFQLDSVTVGTSIKLKYQVYNDRMQEYRKITLTEKEDWHPDFADIVGHITKLAAAECTIDITNEKIRNLRAKSLKFEGLQCVAEVHVYTTGKLDPFGIKTHSFNVPAEVKKQITEEAEAYAMKDKRAQGELFGLGDAIVKNPDAPEYSPEVAPEMEAA